MISNYRIIVEELKELDYKYNKNNENIDLENIYDSIVFVGILSSLMNNKKIFRRNIDLVNFLELRFGIKFAAYCIKSRPLIIGKTMKFFNENYENIDYKEQLNIIYKFIHMALHDNQQEITWNDIINKIDL